MDKIEDQIKVFNLDWFYGISTIVGYLMPNPFYKYILNILLMFLNEPVLIFSLS